MEVPVVSEMGRGRVVRGARVVGFEMYGALSRPMDALKWSWMDIVGLPYVQVVMVNLWLECAGFVVVFWRSGMQNGNSVIVDAVVADIYRPLFPLGWWIHGSV